MPNVLETPQYFISCAPDLTETGEIESWQYLHKLAVHNRVHAEQCLHGVHANRYMQGLCG